VLGHAEVLRARFDLVVFFLCNQGSLFEQRASLVGSDLGFEDLGELLVDKLDLQYFFPATDDLRLESHAALLQLAVLLLCVGNQNSFGEGVQDTFEVVVLLVQHVGLLVGEPHVVRVVHIDQNGDPHADKEERDLFSGIKGRPKVEV